MIKIIVQLYGTLQWQSCAAVCNCAQCAAPARTCSQLFATVRNSSQYAAIVCNCAQLFATVRLLCAKVRTARLCKIFLCGTAHIFTKKGVRKISLMCDAHMPHSEKQTLPLSQNYSDMNCITIINTLKTKK